MLCIHLVRNQISQGQPDQLLRSNPAHLCSFHLHLMITSSMFPQELLGLLIGCGIHSDLRTDLLSVDDRQNGRCEPSSCCEMLLQNDSRSNRCNII